VAGLAVNCVSGHCYGPVKGRIPRSAMEVVDRVAENIVRLSSVERRVTERVMVVKKVNVWRLFNDALDSEVEVSWRK